MGGDGAGIVYCIASLDTKGKELDYLIKCICEALDLFHAQAKIVTVDVSTSRDHDSKNTGDEFVSRETVLSHHPDARSRELSSLPAERGAATSVMAAALEGFLRTKSAAAGAIGVGGSGGTGMISPALRNLSIGIPKVIVSTVASGNTAAYIGSSDLILVPSVVDVAGINSVSTTIFANAAAAFAGMVAARVPRKLSTAGVIQEKLSARPSVGVTMFGVTTPCVTAVREELERRGYEVVVFHATGTGGKAMENLVAQGFFQAVLDLTTTEVADHIVGGVMACDENRFTSTVEKKIPLVLSLGALDMVNFGSKETVPSEFSGRKFHVHNSQVTLMRTTAEENRKFAKFIAERVNRSSAPVRILCPLKGVSALDAEGMPFFCPEATDALLDELKKEIHQTPDRQLEFLPCNINDPEYSRAVVEAFLELVPPVDQAKIPPADELDNTSTKSTSVTRKPPLPSIRKDAKPGSYFCLIHSRTHCFIVPETVLARETILANLKKQIKDGAPVIGAGAGTGISAKFEEEGGVDLIVIYNSGRFRMAGRGSLAGLLPFKDANAVVVDMANEVLPVVKKTPVLAGVCATDPFRQMSRFLRELEQIGFVGVQNFPTVGLFDGNFRQNLEETGMGFGAEVEMIKQAHEMGLITTPYAFNEEESRAMAQAGADIIVAHMGLTTAGSIGASTALTLDQSVDRVQKIANAASEINPDIIVLCHGGPIAGPEDAKYVLQRTTGVHGFYGASSMERLPVERAIRETVCQYKAITK
ncbi:uncharacterized protein LOC9632075 isoform X1 [Selaginella moellendorffii]|uniref:uncharacterized protein LOC9632075 isoform X1 n=1 Tax=Selaginella moellendorffii TaxID=88036 RepID=UPI000D1C3575|nr:uncharacterized protein LOC9632075 isoform X1 [Selaginella moellendorffii]|eukprot:XP_024527788.1 uncharacterized protein LOC9632075 isoform X1 [Selaginella moellendorffii]